MSKKEGKMKKALIACSIIASIVAALWINDIVSDRRNELEILTSITLLEKAPQSYPHENSDIGLVQAGEKVKVLRMGYGKDFRAWKVQGSTGQEGWLVEEHGNVKVMN
jgi:hypothetical protein